ncbi:immunity 26/phosphotriesterase HocA family protein [Microlunatus spumicola]|uniref:Immunity 26/phosphotriesterase HocA family protein n=1 Tax=Microlunatus spumicola TaxID=81499 RepID=A0ABP6WJT5_9ACTN
MPSNRADKPVPFVPRSNASLLTGQFWPIPLDNGLFAAGVVLGVPSEVTLPQHAGSRRLFVAGLLDWHGPDLPDAHVLEGTALRGCGTAHVTSIELTSAGRGIVGRLVTVPSGLAYLSHRAGPGVQVLINGRPDHAASAEEREQLEVWGTWGLTYVQGLANTSFGATPPACVLDRSK